MYNVNCYKGFVVNKHLQETMLDLSKTYTVKEIEELPYFIYLKTFDKERIAITDSIKDIDSKKFIIGIVHNPYNKLTEKDLRI